MSKPLSRERMLLIFEAWMISKSKNRFEILVFLFARDKEELFLRLWNDG